MTIVVLDLEWNGAYSRKARGYFNEIIEIGAVKINEGLEQTDVFKALVKPVFSRKLSPLVCDLTGIKEEEFVKGLQFTHAVSQLRKWIADPKAIVMTWSKTDLMVLLENCRYFLHKETIPFMNYYVDLQAYCQKRLEYGSSQQLGLGKACELLSIAEDNLSMHRALDDSILSGQVFSRIFDAESFQKEVYRTDQKFYDRLTFKPTIVSDIHNVNVKRNDLRFHCEECGRSLRRISDWQFRSRAFCADFLCRHCGIQYIARVQVKLIYDGAVTKRRLTLKPAQEPPTGSEHEEESGSGLYDLQKEKD